MSAWRTQVRFRTLKCLETSRLGDFLQQPRCKRGYGFGDLGLQCEAQTHKWIGHSSCHRASQEVLIPSGHEHSQASSGELLHREAECLILVAPPRLPLAWLCSQKPQAQPLAKETRCPSAHLWDHCTHTSGQPRSRQFLKAYSVPALSPNSLKISSTRYHFHLKTESTKTWRN